MSEHVRPRIQRVLKTATRPKSARAAAEEVGVDDNTAREALEDLVESGRVHRLRLNKRMTVYWDEPWIPTESALSAPEE